MAYPPESQVRLPLLRFAKDGKLKSVLDAEKYLSKRFKLTNAEINRTKKSEYE